MKEFKRGEQVRIKRLDELKYTEQDELTTEDFAKLGLHAVFMYYDEGDTCMVSIERQSYQIPLWLLTKDESESLISRAFRVETYQRTNHKEISERIAYLTLKTAFNFKVEQSNKEIKIYIEK